MAGRTRRVEAKQDAFWDASALVPLCTTQPISDTVNVLYEAYSVTVWWGTSVEIASALAREQRMGKITPAELFTAKSIAGSMEQAWTEVAATAKLRSDAHRLLEKHALRAADALQLSAALAWCEHEPATRIFLTADDRLREAARLSGFNVSLL